MISAEKNKTQTALGHHPVGTIRSFKWGIVDRFDWLKSEFQYTVSNFWMISAEKHKFEIASSSRYYMVGFSGV